MNRTVKILGCVCLGIFTTSIFFLVMMWMVIPEEEVETIIICSFPERKEMVNSVCKCKYNAASGKTKRTEVGLGCNAIYFEGLVGSAHPQCI